MEYIQLAIIILVIAVIVYGSWAGGRVDETTGKKVMTMRAKPVVGWIAAATILHGLALRHSCGFRGRLRRPLVFLPP